MNISSKRLALGAGFGDSKAPRQFLTPAFVGLWAAAAAVAPDYRLKLLLALPPLAAALAWWILLSPERWLGLFLVSAILLPPLPGGFGDSGLHIAPLFLPAGMVVAALGVNQWRPIRGLLPLSLLLFLLALAVSVAFAGIYSGEVIAFGSLVRTALFGIGVAVFFFTLAGPRNQDSDPLQFARWLFVAAALGALFACVDFYFQLPSPAKHEEQFIWVGQDVLRRAQGLFYEASTLGNFCAFFLTMILVGCFQPAADRPWPRIVLALGGVVFAAALILSFSRASILTVAVAAGAFAFLRGFAVRRAIPLLTGSLLGAVLLFQIALPGLSAHYWNRIAISIQYLWSAPNGVLSGRLSSWNTIVAFLLHQPWYAVFGIGYKTLPYTDLAGHNLVADNTYLGLLIETGVVGLSAFLLLNGAILKAALAAARSSLPRTSFFGTWIFCFWCGQMVQMLSGDLITYWRVLPLYFWVLAIAAREAAA